MCGAGRAGRGGGDTDGAVLRRYYGERDYITSAEGVLKLVSVVLCVVQAVLPPGAGCAGAARAALPLAAAAVLAGVCAARLLRLAVHAPMCCLLADLILSTVIGVLLLASAVAGLAACAAPRAADYVHGLLGIANAGTVTASAVVTYVSVSRRWDAARGGGGAGAREAGAAPPELEV